MQFSQWPSFIELNNIFKICSITLLFVMILLFWDFFYSNKVRSLGTLYKLIFYKSLNNKTIRIPNYYCKKLFFRKVECFNIYCDLNLNIFQCLIFQKILFILKAPKLKVCDVYFISWTFHKLCLEAINWTTLAHFISWPDTRTCILFIELMKNIVDHPLSSLQDPAVIIHCYE